MSDDKHVEDDPQRTLLTLDQLSQTIEVMTSVVNRLRQHLSEQIKAQMEIQQDAEEAPSSIEEASDENDAIEAPVKQESQAQRESFIVEISQPETEAARKSAKTLH